MTAAEARAIADFLIADFEYEIQTTMRVIGAVPDTKLDHQPDPKSKSAPGLIRHLALEDEWFLDCVAKGQFTPPPDDSDACGIMTSKDAAACYAAKVPPALDRFKAMSGEQLTGIVDLFGIVQMPALNFLSMAMRHSVHHRGQLSTYLRPMGGKVPGIYGPSGDSQ